MSARKTLLLNLAFQYLEADGHAAARQSTSPGSSQSGHSNSEQAERDAKRKAEAEAKAKVDAEAKAKADAEAKAKAEADAKAKAEADAKARQEQEEQWPKDLAESRENLIRGQRDIYKGNLTYLFFALLVVVEIGITGMIWAASGALTSLLSCLFIVSLGLNVLPCRWLAEQCAKAWFRPVEPSQAEVESGARSRQQYRESLSGKTPVQQSVNDEDGYEYCFALTKLERCVLLEAVSHQLSIEEQRSFFWAHCIPSVLARAQAKTRRTGSRYGSPLDCAWSRAFGRVPRAGHA
jgi:hypothetical protein